MGLQMAATPMYVMIGIFVAIAAIVSADIRVRDDPRSQLPRTHVNRVALLILFGVSICLVQINAVMLFQENTYAQMTKLAVADFVVHSFTLFLLFVLVCLWYRSVAKHRETPAGMMPPNPSTGIVEE